MNRFLHIIFVMFLLSGCVAGPTATAQPSQEIPAMTTLGNIQTSIAQTPIRAAPVTLVPSKTPSPEPTRPVSVVAPTYQPNDKLIAKCVEQDLSPENNLGAGVIVLENRKDDGDGHTLRGFFLLDLQTEYLIDLDSQPDKYVGSGSVSPDRSLLAVSVRSQTDEIVVMDAQGNIKATVLEKQGWVGFDWLNDQELIINLAGLDPKENAQKKLSTSMVLNPFTGEEKILKPDYPDAYVYDAGIALRHFKWLSGTAYNAALTRVVYLGENGFSYILWDLQKNKPLVRLMNRSLMAQPRWSPDGTRFAMLGYLGDISELDTSQAYPYALYMIDQDGTATKLIDDLGLNIDDYFWSPSGRYLALFLNTPPNYTQKRIAILDTQTLEVTDTCLQIPENLDRTAPVWSPDETQILLDDAYEENHRRVILVDMKKNIAFPIAEDMIATGWMKAP